MAVMKLAVTNIDVYLFNAVRLSLSALVLGICAWWEARSGRLAWLETPKNPLVFAIQVCVFAVLTGAVYQIVFAIGLSLTTAGNTALIMSSMPMWTAVIAFLVLREKLGLAWFGLLIAFLGTIVVTLEKGIDGSQSHLIGNGVVLVAALAWAAAAVVSRPMMRFISPIRLAFYATLGTMPIHFLVYPILGGESQASIFEPTMMACVFYSGVFSTGVAYALWNFGVQKIGPSHAAVYQNLVPVVALLAAYLLVGEEITWLQTIGGLTIVVGLFLTRRWRPK